MKKKEPPFPQANNIDLIYEIFCTMNDDGLSKFDITDKYKLHDRQGAYYLDSLLFLNLVEKINTKYFIRADVMEIVGDNTQTTCNMFCKLVLNHPFLNMLYNDLRLFGNDDDKNKYIAAKIREVYKLGDGTSKRRASSIVNWFVWIKKNMDGIDSE